MTCWPYCCEPAGQVPGVTVNAFAQLDDELRSAVHLNSHSSRLSGRIDLAKPLRKMNSCKLCQEEQSERCLARCSGKKFTGGNSKGCLFQK
eukprot:5498973-Karenia_brevis.AAC.1